MPTDLSELIHNLTVPHRRRAAVREFLAMGYDAAPIAVDGLQHPHAGVRSACCEFLDHFLVPEALPGLVELLDDPHPRVRLMALHALACDRCKEDGCRPSAADVVPKAVRALRSDPSPHTRAMAIELVGAYVHTHVEAERALVEAAENDASPAVRKKARWFAPGGPIHLRTRPRPSRTTSG